jgi:putative endonuclease
MSQSSPKTTSISASLGLRGEEFAAAYLEQLGYRLVAANFIVPVGRNRNNAIVNAELDLVAYDGPVLCFVEVKTRASDWFAPPTANVDLRKQRQITRAARVYRRMFGLGNARYRFDVVSIVLPTKAESANGEHSASISHAGPKGEEARTLQIEVRRNFWTEEKFRKVWLDEGYWN